MSEQRLYLFGEITPELAQEIIDGFYEAVCAGEKKVVLKINSPGGCAASAYAILDDMRGLASRGFKVDVVVRGEAASAAALLLAGATGQRIAGPNSQIMLHRAKVEDGYSDVESVHECLTRLDAAMFQLLEQTTPRDAAYWAGRIGRGDLWLSADEAFAEGIIDGVG